MKSDTDKTNIGNSNWEQQKMKMKEQFPHLTDEDFLFENGNYFDMFNHIQIKLGFDKAEMVRLLTSL